MTALHNHFFWEQPRIFYMHVHGTGSAAELPRRLKPAIGLIDRSAARTQGSSSRSAPRAGSGLNTAALATIPWAVQARPAATAA